MRTLAFALVLATGPAAAFAQVHLYDREGLTPEEYETIRDADTLCTNGWREFRAAAPRTGRLALVLSFGLADDREDEAIAQDLLEEYAATHPGVHTRYERVTGLEELTGAANRIGETGDQVEALWVLSHGNEAGGEPVLNFRDRAGRSVVHPASVAALALAGLRFAPDATVYFHGCRLLAVEGPENLTLIADAMGLMTGRIYANETVGSYSHEEISLRVAASGPRGCIQAVGGTIFFPVIDFWDTFLANRGWVLIRLPAGRPCTYRIRGRDVLRSMREG